MGLYLTTLLATLSSIFRLRAALEFETWLCAIKLMTIISHRFWRPHTSFDILASACFVAVVTAST